MGVKLGPLMKEFNIGVLIDPDSLAGKILVIDALPTLYQMLAMIRDKRGLYLVDSKGRVTSHLVGLFNRTCRLLAMGIKPVYVFDGPPHPWKKSELEARKKERLEFQKKFIEAVMAGRYEEAKKLGKRAMIVTDDMVKSARKLLELMGVPIIDAPHDAEAQAAYIVARGEGYAVASRDWDAFLYGTPRIIMEFKITINPYERPILYELDKFLSKTGITREQLIDLALILGTDYNPGGFEGIGPKTALKLIKKYKNIENLIANRKIIWKWDIPPEKLRELFLNPPINKNYEIKFRDPDIDGIIEFLVEEHDFNKQRVLNELREALKRLERDKKGLKQASLDLFFR
ncbi:MAG: flap endonuclease-1 [Candidatus Njordarchaeales archaeon]